MFLNCELQKINNQFLGSLFCFLSGTTWTQEIVDRSQQLKFGKYMESRLPPNSYLFLWRLCNVSICLCGIIFPQISLLVYFLLKWPQESSLCEIWREKGSSSHSVAHTHCCWLLPLLIWHEAVLQQVHPSPGSIKTRIWR